MKPPPESCAPSGHPSDENNDQMAERPSHAANRKSMIIDRLHRQIVLLRQAHLARQLKHMRGRKRHRQRQRRRPPESLEPAAWLTSPFVDRRGQRAKLDTVPALL